MKIPFKKLFALCPVLLLFCFSSACNSVHYTGESLPPRPADAVIPIYYSKTQLPPSCSVLGTAEYLAEPKEPRADIRAALIRCAREHGADAILITAMKPLASGEARQDQINNEPAPGWSVTDNSATALTYMQDTIYYSSGSDPERTLYRMKVSAEFLVFPKTEPANAEPLRLP